MTTIAMVLALLLTVPVWKPATVTVRVPDECRKFGAVWVSVTGPGGFDTVTAGPVIVCAGIRPGVHRVTVQDGLGQRASSVVQCPPDGRLNVELCPRKISKSTGYVQGTVLESKSREPIAGCQVSIRGRMGSTTTIEDGTYLLEEVDPGAALVVLAVTPRGDTLTALASVSAQKTTTVDLSTARPFVSTVTKGLVAAYTCDIPGAAATQPLVDISGFGRHGVMVGATPAMNRMGAIGHAAHFNGSSYAEVPHAAWQSLMPMTASFYIRVDPRQPKTCFLLGKYLHPSGEGWCVFLENGLLCAGYFRYGFGNWTRVNTETDITNNTWRHVVITVDQTALTLWVDGARTPARAFAAKADVTTSTEPFRFGQLRSTTWPVMDGLIGDLDDIAIYDRVLSEEEIVRLRE